MLIFSYIKRKFLNVEFIILQYRISKHNYNIVRKPTPGLSSLVVKNVFKTQYEKNALISYLVSPFIDSINFSHSNFQECQLMAEILHKLNYNVDVINWDNHEFKPEISYDLVIDNNNNLERLKLDLPNTEEHNSLLRKRILELEKELEEYRSYKSRHFNTAQGIIDLLKT